MVQQQQSRWQRTRRPLLWAVGIVAVLTIAVLIGYRYDITLWDWLKLLVVPTVIAAGGLWFNRQQRERELEISERRAQDEALQAYLEGMAQLVADKERPLHRAQPGDSLSSVARARTLTVLSRLDGERRAQVVQFLFESKLIYEEQSLIDEEGLIERIHNIVSLKKANVSLADLSGTYLAKTNLSEANLHGANLSETFLFLTNLSGANLSEANLRRAFLISVDLSYATLSEANLRGAFLAEANLRGTQLSGADLEDADLSGTFLFLTNLSGANLSGANLNGAERWTEEQLTSAKLEGATMPNGQKYEDWLKDKKARREDVENE